MSISVGTVTAAACACGGTAYASGRIIIINITIVVTVVVVVGGGVSSGVDVNSVDVVVCEREESRCGAASGRLALRWMQRGSQAAAS